MSYQSSACSLGEALFRAGTLMDHLFLESVGDADTLRQVEFVLLQVIARIPGANQKRLTAAVGMSAPHISLAIDRLLCRGLVERVQASSDGRFRCLALTDLGRELAAQTNMKLLHCEQLALPQVSRAERDFLCELLLRVAARRVDKPSTSIDVRVNSNSDALDAVLQGSCRASSPSKSLSL